MEEIKVRGEYITLGQFLKVVNVVDSGSTAKLVIVEGLVKVNNEVEVRRGKKLRNNDVVSFDGNDFKIVIDEN